MLGFIVVIVAIFAVTYAIHAPLSVTVITEALGALTGSIVLYKELTKN